MKQNYRPTLQGLDYFEKDLTQIMIDKLGFENDNEYFIKGIDWYDWDENPRWFVMVHIWGAEDGKWKKKGYCELDVYGYEGAETLSIERVDMAGHGYPCNSTLVAEQDGDEGWKINEVY